jgi:hypothetical protein
MGARWALAILGACIVALAVLGNVAESGEPPHVWDLGKERSIPTGFSALLLCVAGGMSLAYGYSDRQADGTAKLMGLFLFTMAFDEFVAIHERPEDITGIPWPLFWLPVMAVGALLGIAMLALLPRPADRFWLGGALGWLCAPVLDIVHEAVAPRGDPVREAISNVEELAELTGSALFIAALMTALQISATRAPVRAARARGSTTRRSTDPRSAPPPARPRSP